MGFNHERHLKYFAYYFILPDNKDFRYIKVFAKDKEACLIRETGKIAAKHIIRNVRPRTQTNYRFINK